MTKGRKTTEEEFWQRVERRGPDECWPWMGEKKQETSKGSRVEDGYGVIYWKELTGQRRTPAHRVVYFLEHGEWPAVVMHSCDNPPCCNPAHLVGGTNESNCIDMLKKRRQATGERVGTSKLTKAKVEDIRQKRANGALLRDLAEEYEVTVPCIHLIVTGKTWGGQFYRKKFIGV